MSRLTALHIPPRTTDALANGRADLDRWPGRAQVDALRGLVQELTR